MVLCATWSKSSRDCSRCVPLALRMASLARSAHFPIVWFDILVLGLDAKIAPNMEDFAERVQALPLSSRDCPFLQKGRARPRRSWKAAAWRLTAM